MTTINVNITRSGALLTNQAPQVIQAGLDRFVEEAVQFLDGQVKARTPQGVFGAQGGLLGSIQTPPITGKGTPIVKGRVVSAHPYVEVIEKGRRPGKGIASAEPGDKYVSPLLPWIRVKLGLSGKEAEHVAYLIGRKIRQKGFEGHHMFEKAVTENQSTLDQMAERAGLAIAVELDK